MATPVPGSLLPCSGEPSSDSALSLGGVEELVSDVGGHEPPSEEEGPDAWLEIDELEASPPPAMAPVMVTVLVPGTDAVDGSHIRRTFSLGNSNQ